MRRARKVIAFAVAFLVALALTLIATTPPASALALIKFGKSAGCPVIVGIRQADPIVHANEPEPAGHLHAFFGSPVPFDNGDATTFAQMMAPRSNPCAAGFPGDTAGYWFPVLCTDATCASTVPVLHTSAYYRAFNGQPQGPAQPIPDGAKLVTHTYNWTCGQNSGPVLSAPVDHIPDCPGVTGKPGNTLTLHLTFNATCYDGVPPDNTDGRVGDLQESSHYVPPVGSGKRTTCPATNPIGVTQLRETIEFAHVGPAGDLILSSDVQDGTTGGRSAHGDVWETWQPGQQDAMLATCVRPARAGKGCG